MHVITWVIIGVFSYLKGDWKKFSDYYSTMLFTVVANFLYNYLCADYLTWSYVSPLINAHKPVDLFYTLYFLPLTVFMFLSLFPKTKKLSYCLKWILVYWLWEIFLHKLGLLKYDHGWSLWWSLFFYCTMFPMFIIHYKKPKIAYILSFFVVLFFYHYFNVPSIFKE